MSDEMIRLKLHAAADDCLSGVARMPSQKKAVLDRIESMEQGRAARRRPRMAVALAMVMLLTLAGGAVAAGLGLFGQLREQRTEESSYERLARLDEAAASVGETATLEGGTELTLEQVYCDGDRLYYSYTLAGENVVLGDGADLADGTSLTIWDRGEETTDGVTYGYQEVELPEKAKPGEAISVVLTVIAEGEDGAHRYMKAPFTVTPVQRETRTGSASFAQYAADALLYVTDVEIYGEVDVTGQMGWAKLYQNRADTDEEDYVVDYQLIVDGEVFYNKDYTYGEADGGYGIPVRYDLPASYESLVLRPVRYLSGECSEEEIVLK